MTRQHSIGFGCATGATAEDILALIQRCVVRIAPGTVLATIDRRAGIARVIAHSLGVELRLFSSHTLADVPGVIHHSAVALRVSGTSSVAEGAALAALGPAAQLAVPRQTGRLCTCAVAVLP